MDAVVLVGGEGTRLRPLTYDAPKQMLPVVDRPMIEHVVAWLGHHGVGRVVLSLGYRPDAFLEAFPSGRLGDVQLAYAIEPELLDTAGAVRFATESAGVEGPFLVLNGDVLSDFDLGALVAFHQETGAEATIQLTPVPDPSAFGVVPTDESGRVTAFIEKPPPGEAPTNLVNAGCYVLEPSVLRRVETGRRVSIERETFPALVADGTLFAMSSDAYWLDTGTPQKFIDASLDVLHGRRTELSRPRAEEIATGVFVGERASTDGEIETPAYLGPGSKVAKGSTISNSVIGADVEIDHAAVISGSVIMEGAVVGEGARIESSIIGPSASVGAGAKITGCSVVRGRSRVAPDSQLASARHPSP